MRMLGLTNLARSTAVHLLVAVLLAAGVASGVAGCLGTEKSKSDSTPRSAATVTSSSVGQALSSQTANLIGPEQLSTFQAKDPFSPQYVPTTSASTSTSVSVPATVAPGSTTSSSTVTTISRTTTTRTTTSTTESTTSSTTTSTGSTTTTAPPLHVMKILSVEMVGGAPAATIKVDGTVFKDCRVSDLLSTTWGQMKILDISLASRVVTILHRGEVLWLEAGQVVREWP